MKYIVPALAVALLLASGGLLWNEARKEIVFLCGNFHPGVTEGSVVRQLDTGHFLRYRRESLLQGERIVADSVYNFGVYTCSIDFDTNRVVTEARVN